MFRTLLVALFLCFSSAHAQQYCARASGYYSTEYGYVESAGLRELCKKLAGGKKYLLISRIDWGSADNAVASTARPFAIRKFIESGGAHDPDIKSIIDQEAQNSNATYIDRKMIELLVVNQLFDHTRYGTGNAVEYFYVYHSDTGHISSLTNGIGYEKGVTIESRPADAGDIFALAGNPNHPLMKMVAGRDIGAVILQGINLPTDLARYLPERTPVFHLNLPVRKDVDRLEHGARELAGFIGLGNDTNGVRIVNLFPTAAHEAVAWGFDQLLAERYGEAGESFERQLGDRGYGAFVSRPAKKAAFLAELQSAAEKGSKTLVIAEANSNGEIRIPGSTDLIRSEDLKSVGSLENVYFLFCNSARITAAGTALRFEGKVFTEDAATIIEYLLPRVSSPDESGERVLMRVDPSDLIGFAVTSMSGLACALVDEDEDEDEDEECFVLVQQPEA